MLLEDSVCLFVNYGGPKAGNFDPLVFIPASPSSQCFLSWFTEFCQVLLVLNISIVSDLISNTTFIFLFYISFYISLAILMDLGKRRDKCYNAVAHHKIRSFTEKDTKVYLLFSG